MCVALGAALTDGRGGGVRRREWLTQPADRPVVISTSNRVERDWSDRKSSGVNLPAVVSVPSISVAISRIFWKQFGGA